MESLNTTMACTSRSAGDVWERWLKRTSTVHCEYRKSHIFESPFWLAMCLVSYVLMKILAALRVKLEPVVGPKSQRPKFRFPSSTTNHIEDYDSFIGSISLSRNKEFPALHAS